MDHPSGLGSGPVLRARPTLYKGIQMRSRLEARMAGVFDRLGLPWRYEPRCFADENGQYLPDFLLGEHTYLEIKPLSVTGAEVEAMKARMEIIFSSEPDAVLWIVATDGEKTAVDHGVNYGDGWIIENRSAPVPM